MHFLPILVVGALALGAMSCGSPVTTQKSSAPPFSVPTGTWADASNPTPNESPSDRAGFFLKLTSDTAQIILHRSDTAYGGDPGTGSFTTECRIPVGGTDRDFLCIAEIEELDVYFSELNLQYHFPPSMCSYAKFRPYYFYAAEPGEGLTALTVTRDEFGSVIANSAGVDPVTGEPICDYDYTPTGGPNCCVGNYSLTTTQQNPAPDPPTITTDPGEWGGTVGACIGGPGKTESYSDYIGPNGIPLTKVAYVAGEGLNETFKILPPIQNSFGESRANSNVWTANFYEVSDHSAQSPGVLPADRPLALRIPASLAGGAFEHLPSDTYTFECHDRAEEMQYRIRLMIREWNQDPVVAGGDPEIDGIDDPHFPGRPINDREDWLDIGNAYPDTSI